MYEKLKNITNQCCLVSHHAIFYFMDLNKDKNHNTYFRLFFDCFKGIELICHAIDIKAYTQSGILLRNSIEQVSILQVIIENKQCLESYEKFATLKLNLTMNREKFIEQAKNMHKQSKIDSKFNDFIDFGWLEELGEQTFTIDTIINRANYPNLAVWRKYCNKLVHGNISFTQLKEVGIKYYVENFIYISAFLLDRLLCLFHNLTGYDFVFDNINYRKLFMDQYQIVTNLKKKPIS